MQENVDLRDTGFLINPVRSQQAAP
ncbi:hypothetical protein A2U01_0095691, partial [Trifolium medium]|nr:hypothetical protein [Trifolium medium]